MSCIFCSIFGEQSKQSIRAEGRLRARAIQHYIATTTKEQRRKHNIIGYICVSIVVAAIAALIGFILVTN